MQALTDSIRVVFHLKKNEFKALVVTFQEDFLGKPGQIKFEELLASNISEVNSMLSKQYRRKILYKYYSEYGIISTIHDALKQLYLNMYDDLSRDFN